MTMDRLKGLELFNHLLPDHFAGLLTAPQEAKFFQLLHAFFLHLAHALALPHVAHLGNHRKVSSTLNGAMLKAELNTPNGLASGLRSIP